MICSRRFGRFNNLSFHHLMYMTGNLPCTGFIFISVLQHKDIFLQTNQGSKCKKAQLRDNRMKEYHDVSFSSYMLRNDNGHNSIILSSTQKLVRHFHCKNFPVLKMVKGKGGKIYFRQIRAGTRSSVGLLHTTGNFFLLQSRMDLCAKPSKER